MKPVFLMFGLTMALVVASQARAESSGSSVEVGEWSFTLAPYMWAAGLKGDVATLPPAPAAEVDADFADILEDLDIALMGIGEARKGRFALTIEVVYVDLSDDSDTPGPFFSGADFETEMFIGTFQGSFRATEGAQGHLDLLAGARVWSVTTDLSLEAGLLPSRDLDDSETWVDPVIGAQGRFDIAAGLYVTAMGNVGGFGVGSDLTWDVFGGLGYQANDWFAPVVGYRYLSVDYDDGDFLYDVDVSGPVIGGVIRF